MMLDFDRMGGLRWLLRGIGLATALFLLLPILFIVALSFGSSQWLIFPPPGWTLRWYRELFADPRWLGAILTSAEVAVLVTIASVTSASWRRSGSSAAASKAGRRCAFFLTPMILPVVVLAVALYALFLRLQAQRDAPWLCDRAHDRGAAIRDHPDR